MSGGRRARRGTAAVSGGWRGPRGGESSGLYTMCGLRCPRGPPGGRTALARTGARVLYRGSMDTPSTGRAASGARPAPGDAGDARNAGTRRPPRTAVMITYSQYSQKGV